jgi:hypothetical protein
MKASSTGAVSTKCVAKAPPRKGLACPSCGGRRLSVVYTRDGAGGTVRRSRRCGKCGARFKTGEAVLPGRPENSNDRESGSGSV